MRKAIMFITSPLMMAQATLGLAVTVPGALVETDWLNRYRQEIHVLDIRSDLKGFTTKPVYAVDKKSGKKRLVELGGHIPDAVLVDYKKIRANRLVNGVKVEKLVPEKSQFEALMRVHGVNQGSAIVITSEGMGDGDLTMATRLYWQLKYYGHENVAVLNGGYAQWLVEGRSNTIETTKPKPGNWKATAVREELFASSDEVARAVKDKRTQLVDNRPLSQYLGVYKKSYVYANGHIPGAKPFPNELMTEGSAPAKFLPVKDLRALVEAMGIDSKSPSITYCNSGHLASGGWFILRELLGNKSVQLYDGSMHQWTLEKRPVIVNKME